MKTEVYSWRLSPHLKAELEEAARVERKSVADLLEQIAQDWLERSSGRSRNEEERQQQLHKAALESAGSIQGNDPNRAENARSEVRSRIARRHGR
jgi:predicted nuclease of restriction endonuclease-like (RecB) superfamily